MRISTASKSDPASPPVFREQRNQFIWAELALRLIEPTRLAIMEALVRLERPLSASDLAPMVDAPEELVRYHCRLLAKAGVLEVVEVRLRPGTRGDQSFFDFPSLPPGQSSPPPVAAA